MNIIEIIKNIFINNAFVMSFLFIALGVFVSSVISKYIFKGKQETAFSSSYGAGGRDSRSGHRKDGLAGD